MKKRLIGVVAVITSLLLGAELFARFGLGLGNPPLSEPSAEYGYRFVPNQNIRRFGNRVFYNAYGLRSEPIKERPEPEVTRILCLGDSITNGGVLTDQDETYPYQLQRLLSGSGHRKFEVLNASAGSWGIENEEAYLRYHGLFHSHIIVLQLGTHDLWQKKSSSQLVGTVDFPNYKPLFALQELLFRYLPRYVSLHWSTPRIKKPSLSEKDIVRNLASLERLVSFVRQTGAMIVVILVPESIELDGKIDQYAAGQEILARKVEELSVVYRPLHNDFRVARAQGQNLYRDEVHPNVNGNAVIAAAVAAVVISAFR